VKKKNRDRNAKKSFLVGGGEKGGKGQTNRAANGKEEENSNLEKKKNGHSWRLGKSGFPSEAQRKGGERCHQRKNSVGEKKEGCGPGERKMRNQKGKERKLVQDAEYEEKKGISSEPGKAPGGRHVPGGRKRPVNGEKQICREMSHKKKGIRMRNQEGSRRLVQRCMGLVKKKEQDRGGGGNGSRRRKKKKGPEPEGEETDCVAKKGKKFPFLEKNLLRTTKGGGRLPARKNLKKKSFARMT